MYVATLYATLLQLHTDAIKQSFLLDVIIHEKYSFLQYTFLILFIYKESLYS